MKKILITLSLLLIFVCTSCDYDPVDFVSVGTFYSDNWIFNNKKFPKAKYIITEITKEEYDSSNNVNVFIDDSLENLKKQIYLKIEFYLYSIANDKYIQVEVTKIKPINNKVHYYYGNFKIIDENIDFSGRIYLYLSEGSASNNRDGFYLQNEKYECIIQCRGMNLEELIKEEGDYKDEA